MDIHNAKRILVIGHSGRGKTTFAEKLSEKLNIQMYSTDDFFWEIKYSKIRKKPESVKQVEEVYSSEMWITEGTTNYLIQPAIERAEIIFDLVFSNIFSQWYSIIKRHKTRKDETSGEMLSLLVYVAQRRFGILNKREKEKKEMLKPHISKLKTLSTYKEIDEFIENI